MATASEKFLVLLLKYTLPYVYLNYCRLIWCTSKITDGTDLMMDCFQQGNRKIVSVLWHQDVFYVAWGFQRFSGYTIASVGDAGEVIAHLLKLCKYNVFRGGSSKGKARRKKILDEFVEHLQHVDSAVVGLTVDGSSGPVYRMKTGALVAAVKLGAPMFIVRVWCKRKFFLPTWDRTMIPLPFNEIKVFTEGPFYPPTDINDQEQFKKFHHELETRLLTLTWKASMEMDNKVDPRMLEKFPEDWKPPIDTTEESK